MCWANCLIYWYLCKYGYTKNKYGYNKNMVITKAKFWMHAKFYKYGIGWLQISSNPVLYIWVALSLTVWYVIPFTVNCPGKRAFWWILFTNGHFDEIVNIFPTLVCEWMFWSIISYFMFYFYWPSECANYKGPEKYLLYHVLHKWKLQNKHISQDILNDFFLQD